MIYTAVFASKDHIYPESVLLLPGIHKDYENRWFFNIKSENILLVNDDINNDHDLLWDIITAVIKGDIINMPHIQSVGTLSQVPKDKTKAKEYKKLYGKQL